jgi:hypothetical protein
VANADVTGGDATGGLVGFNVEGTVSNSYFTGTVTGGWRVGGVVGSNGGTVSHSYSTGTVTGYWYVGGLVGRNRAGIVSNSYSAGSVTGEELVGGLVGVNGGPVGVNDGTVSNSYSTSSVTGEERVGGLVGLNEGGPVNNSFWDTETSGQATSDGGTGKTTAEMQDIATFSAGDIIAVANPGMRNPSYTWNIVDGVTYPFLSWQS